MQAATSSVSITLVTSRSSGSFSAKYRGHAAVRFAPMGGSVPQVATVAKSHLRQRLNQREKPCVPRRPRRRRVVVSAATSGSSIWVRRSGRCIAIATAADVIRQVRSRLSLSLTGKLFATRKEHRLALLPLLPWSSAPIAGAAVRQSPMKPRVSSLFMPVRSTIQHK
jgi:hypothetical protein